MTVSGGGRGGTRARREADAWRAEAHAGDGVAEARGGQAQSGQAPTWGGARPHGRIGRALASVAVAGVGVVAAVCIVGVSPAEVHAQTPPVVREVVLNADSAVIGDRVELRVTVEVGANQVVFAPDSLESSGLAPMEPIRWSSTDAPGRAKTVTVTWPMIALDVGALETPEFELFVAPRDAGEGAGLATPGSPLGSWEAFRDDPARLPSAVILPVGTRRLEVRSALELDDVTQVIGPRPAADVSGGDRHWPSTLLTLLFGLTLAGVVTVSARDLVRGARGSAAPDPRARALTALEDVLAEGLHLEGRTRDFYARSSDAVRAYVETCDPRWDRAWTSTELIGDLAGRGGATHALERAMAYAEQVKFGGARPSADVAEEDWRDLRDWVAASQPTPGGP